MSMAKSLFVLVSLVVVGSAVTLAFLDPIALRNLCDEPIEWLIWGIHGVYWLSVYSYWFGKGFMKSHKVVVLLLVSVPVVGIWPVAQELYSMWSFLSSGYILGQVVVALGLYGGLIYTFVHQLRNVELENHRHR